MTVVIGSDHAGVNLKSVLLDWIVGAGHVTMDVGTHTTAPVDYPDFAESVSIAIRSSNAERGILVCGSGVGACVAANKIPGIRAGLCHDVYSAHQGVEHDDMNVLVLGARVIGDALAMEIVRAYLAASFGGEERHRRRLAKVRQIEAQYCGEVK